MVFNGSELINNPFNTVFSPFTSILGSGFWLVPICFIAAALYVKTRDMTATSLFILGSCSILSGGNIFIGNETMGFVFLIFAAFGFIGLVLSIYFMRE